MGILRYLANSYCYAMTTPTSPLAARVAYSLQTYPGGWRNCYYLLIAINATSMIAWYLFYRKQPRQSRRDTVLIM